jgi:hypothetical protein
MNDLENELRKTLSRREAPPGFEQNVLTRIAAERKQMAAGHRGMGSRIALKRWAVLATAACLLVALATARYRHAERERAEGEMARQKAAVALEIASSKLNLALREVARVDRQPPSENPKTRRRTREL